MELTKFEKAMTIGIILRVLCRRKLKKYVDLEKLPALTRVLDEFQENSTVEEREETTANLINKLMDDVIEREEKGDE
ncbi:hypothetical protein V7419_30025 [Bacillus sp. JJ689]|uniref:hypothetical protein n=1 Tax=Bacillus sp. JJ689 TaxID=3122949 RepID=UPI002FFF76FD